MYLRSLFSVWYTTATHYMSWNGSENLYFNSQLLTQKFLPISEGMNIQRMYVPLAWPNIFIFIQRCETQIFLIFIFTIISAMPNGLHMYIHHFLTPTLCSKLQHSLPFSKLCCNLHISQPRHPADLYGNPQCASPVTMETLTPSSIQKSYHLPVYLFIAVLVRSQQKQSLDCYGGRPKETFDDYSLV